MPDPGGRAVSDPTEAIERLDELPSELNIIAEETAFRAQHPTGLITDADVERMEVTAALLREAAAALRSLVQERDDLHTSYNREYVKDTEELWGRINLLTARLSQVEQNAHCSRCGDFILGGTLCDDDRPYPWRPQSAP